MQGSSPVWRCTSVPSQRAPVNIRTTMFHRRESSLVGSVATRASEDDKLNTSAKALEWEDVVTNVGPWLAYAVILYYVSQMSPNQTPLRDQYLIEQLVGILKASDGVKMNTVIFDLFYLMDRHP